MASPTVATNMAQRDAHTPCQKMTLTPFKTFPCECMSAIRSVAMHQFTRSVYMPRRWLPEQRQFDANHDDGGGVEVGGHDRSTSHGDGGADGVDQDDEEDTSGIQTSEDIPEAFTGKPTAQGRKRPREENDGGDQDTN